MADKDDADTAKDEQELRDTLLVEHDERDRSRTYWEAMYNPSDGRPSSRATEWIPGEEGVLAEVRWVARIYELDDILDSIDDMAADRVSWKRKGRMEAQAILTPPPPVAPVVAQAPQAVPPPKRRLLSRVPLVGRFFR